MAHVSKEIMSTEDFSNHLSGSLPVYVSPQDITKHPLLSHMLKDLSLRLTPTGIHRSTHTSLTQASSSLRHARQKYLEGATFHRVLEDVLLDMCDREDSEGLQKQIIRTILEAVTLSEIQDHMIVLRSSEEKQDNVKSNMVTLFGIPEETILKNCKALSPEVHSEVLNAALERFIEQEWIKISSFLNPVGFESCVSQKTTKIVEHLETTRQKLVEERNKLFENVIQTDCLSQKVYGLLFDYSKILTCLVSKQRLSQYPAQHLSNCLVTLKVHFLKLRCIELEILTGTYTSQSVRALKLLQNHMQQRRTHAEQSLVKLKHAMDAYKDLDPKFKDLLKEYAKLQEDINFAKISTGLSNL